MSTFILFSPLYAQSGLGKFFTGKRPLVSTTLSFSARLAFHKMWRIKFFLLGTGLKGDSEEMELVGCGWKGWTYMLNNIDRICRSNLFCGDAKRLEIWFARGIAEIFKFHEILFPGTSSQLTRLPRWVNATWTSNESGQQIPPKRLTRLFINDFLTSARFPELGLFGNCFRRKPRTLLMKSLELGRWLVQVTLCSEGFPN